MCKFELTSQAIYTPTHYPFMPVQLPTTPSASQDRVLGTPSGLTMRWRERFDDLVDRDVDLLLNLDTRFTPSQGPLSQGTRSILFLAIVLSCVAPNSINVCSHVCLLLSSSIVFPFSTGTPSASQSQEGATPRTVTDFLAHAARDAHDMVSRGSKATDAILASPANARVSQQVYRIPGVLPDDLM